MSLDFRNSYLTLSPSPTVDTSVTPPTSSFSLTTSPTNTPDLLPLPPHPSLLPHPQLIPQTYYSSLLLPAMHPSNSVTFEPGVERGVPWGHDLFTFVTSAAGHMMRTLQRPRKNRPSKRQVNHRRFLHNMIQRKFAEIETANHQLASVLFSAEVANSNTPSPSRQPITTDLSNSTSKEAPVSEEADLSLCSHETEALATDQKDPGDQWRLNPKRLQMDQSNSNTPSKGTYQKTHKQGSRIENQTDYRSSITSEKTIVLEQEGEHFHTEPFSCDITSEESLYSWIDSIREKYETQLRRDSNSNITAPTQNMDTSTFNPLPLSPGLSPLSLDSCDFGVTTVEDNAACSQSQNNMADSDTVESQRMDVLRLWDSEVEPQNDGGFRDGMDPQAHLETIWGSPGEERSLANNVHVDDITFLNQSESFIEKLMLHTSSSSDARSEMEQIDCDRGQYEYGSGYGCSIDPVTAIRDFISGQGSSQCMLESAVGRQDTDRQFTCLNITPNQLSTSVGYHCDFPDPNILQRSCPQQDGTFSLVNDDMSQSCIPFEGVARSFPAPVHTPHSHQVLTPPLEDDWLFTDIMGGPSV